MHHAETQNVFMRDHSHDMGNVLITQLLPTPKVFDYQLAGKPECPRREKVGARQKGYEEPPDKFPSVPALCLPHVLTNLPTTNKNAIEREEKANSRTRRLRVGAIIFRLFDI